MLIKSLIDFRKPSASQLFGEKTAHWKGCRWLANNFKNHTNTSVFGIIVSEAAVGSIVAYRGFLGRNTTDLRFHREDPM